MSEEVLLTREDYEQLVEKRDYLVSVRRREVAEHLKEARSHGDLSENSEYDAAKEENAQVEQEIAGLEEMINNARVISEEDISGDVVNLGLTVEIKDLDTKEKDTYTIVGITNADPLENRISNESPVGKALLGKKKGDKVEIIIENREGTGNTVLHYQIMKITKE